MGLGLGRIKLDCADAVQVRGGAKNSRPFIVICPALTFFVKKVDQIFRNKFSVRSQIFSVTLLGIDLITSSAK